MALVNLYGCIAIFMRRVFEWDISLDDSGFLLFMFIELLLIFIYLCTKVKEIDWDKLDKME